MPNAPGTPLDFNCGVCSAKLTDNNSLFTSCGHFFCNNGQCTRLAEDSSGRECDTCGLVCKVGTLANPSSRYEGDVKRFVFVPLEDQLDDLSQDLKTISEVIKFRGRHLRILRENNERQRKKNCDLKQEVYKGVQEAERLRKENQLLRHENAQLRKQLRVVSRRGTARDPRSKSNTDPSLGAPSMYVGSDERSTSEVAISPLPRRVQKLQDTDPRRRQLSPPQQQHVSAPAKSLNIGTGARGSYAANASNHRSKSLSRPYALNGGGNTHAHGQRPSYGFNRGANGANASVKPSRSLHPGTRKAYGFSRTSNVTGKPAAPPPSYTSAALGRSNFSRKYAGDSHATRATAGTRATGGTRAAVGTRATGGTRGTGGTLLRRSNATGVAESRLPGGGAKRGEDPVERRRTKGISKPLATSTNRRQVEPNSNAPTYRTALATRGVNGDNISRFASSRPRSAASNALSSRTFGGQWNMSQARNQGHRRSSVITKDLRAVSKPSATPASMIGTRRKKHSLFGRYE